MIKCTLVPKRSTLQLIYILGLIIKYFQSGYHGVLIFLVNFELIEHFLYPFDLKKNFSFNFLCGFYIVNKHPLPFNEKDHPLRQKKKSFIDSCVVDKGQNCPKEQGNFF